MHNEPVLPRVLDESGRPVKICLVPTTPGSVSHNTRDASEKLALRVKPPARTSDPHQSAILRPYLVEVEADCEECGGSGVDPGALDPWGPESCPRCQGARTQRMVRNYLAEAFQIAGNPDGTRPVERQHLVVIIQHFRAMVSAFASLPDVGRSNPGPPDQVADMAASRFPSRMRSSHSRRTHGSARGDRNQWIEDRKEVRRNVAFRPKWT